MLEALRLAHERDQDHRGPAGADGGRGRQAQADLRRSSRPPPRPRQAVGAFLADKLPAAVNQRRQGRARGRSTRCRTPPWPSSPSSSRRPTSSPSSSPPRRSCVRGQILEKGIRPDGRDTLTVRPISCEVGLLPRTHGSGLFTRGQTQVLTIATLGSVADEQMLDGISLVDSPSATCTTTTCRPSPAARPGPAAAPAAARSATAPWPSAP